MESSEVTPRGSPYSQKCASCRTLICCATFEELQQLFTGKGGKSVKSCKHCRATTKSLGASVRVQEETSFGLDEHFEVHEDFIEVVSSFLELHDRHVFDSEAQPLKLRVTLSESVVLGNDISVALCAQREDRDAQKQAAIYLRNDIFDCSGYYFHLRRCKERPDGPDYFLTCSRSQERKTERDPLSLQRYTSVKEFFPCHGELHITFSKSNLSVTITYDHKCHTETPKFHVTEEFKETELHTITKQQVYNVWLSLTRKEWERDDADDFKSAQMLLDGQDGYRLIEGLQEPGVSLAFTTPCFNDTIKFNRTKMTEVFIDSTFGTNIHGYELYCVLTEYDLVSLPLSYLLLDTRGIQEVGKRGSRLTAWLTALRATGLNPNVVHTDKDFAEVTAASIAFKANNDRYNHHLCHRHSLRAIDQYITGKMKSKGFDSVDNSRNSTRLTALPRYLYFLSEESDWMQSNGQSKKCTPEKARILRAMIKRHLLRHPFLPKTFLDGEGTPALEGLQYQTYEEIHANAIKEMLEFCKTIDQPKIFRYFWNNWYRPAFKNIGSRWEIASLCGRPGANGAIPISRTTMRLESHWRILKKDYGSRFIKPRLDVLAYIICTGLVRSRIHLYLQVEAGREKPSAYKDLVHLWRKCADAINQDCIVKRDKVYHTDKDQWLCSCPSFILNSRYLCKHLVSFYSRPQPDGNGRFLVQPPPLYSPRLFQERLPLIRFSEHEINGPMTISSGEDLSDCIDDDDARSVSYAEELASLELVSAENPEAAEENDEDIKEFLRVVHWASGPECESNPRMQRAFYRHFSNKEASFLSEFKRPYEEAVGTSRSGSSNTMRKAPRSYYYSRPQNQSRVSRE
ncbi:hypothetical protein V1509DRAFT_650584 [Lipomyces kononenkoae]